MGGKSAEAVDIRFLLSALLYWFLSCLLLLPLSAVGAQLFECGEMGLAYISSALSFAAAAAAGAKAMYMRRKNAVGTALVTGVCIIILALTLGFLIAGDKIESAGVLSVVSFTISGCMVGTVFFTGRKKQNRKSRRKTVKKKA